MLTPITLMQYLHLLIIFVIIKSLPPLLSWFIIDANIAGDQKKLVVDLALVGLILKFGLEDLFMECTQMLSNGV